MSLQDTATDGDQAARKAKRAEKRAERSARASLFSSNGIPALSAAAAGQGLSGLWNVSERLQQRLKEGASAVDLPQCRVSVILVAEDTEGTDTYGQCFGLALGMRKKAETADIKDQIVEGKHAFHVSQLDKMAVLTKDGEVNAVLSSEHDIIFPVIMREGKVVFFAVAADEEKKGTWTLSRIDPDQVVTQSGPVMIALRDFELPAAEAKK